MPGGEFTKKEDGEGFASSPSLDTFCGFSVGMVIMALTTSQSSEGRETKRRGEVRCGLNIKFYVCLTSIQYTRLCSLFVSLVYNECNLFNGVLCRPMSTMPRALQQVVVVPEGPSRTYLYACS